MEFTRALKAGVSLLLWLGAVAALVLTLVTWP